MATGNHLSNLTSAKAVQDSLEEFRELGRSAFLDRYGFKGSRRYFVIQDGIGYDSKPIAAAAYGHQHGREEALHFDDFSGGTPVISKMSKLGYMVSDWTSPQFEIGKVFTRDLLREMFEIKDATINTGVFRPQASNSIWLFITRDKQKDRTQYKDHFNGDLLFWQGQTKGRTDSAIIDHEAAGDELLVFYRDSKRSHPGAGFLFEGQFRYLSHSGESPTDFVLQRVNTHEEVEAPEDKFDPSSIEDGRKQVWAKVKRRQGQQSFRRGLVRAYGGRCAVTGCTIEPLLEAAHIHPYRGTYTNGISNGLLLRADIHTLFDLGMITVTPAHKIEVSAKLHGTEYASLCGQPIKLPQSAIDRPSDQALDWHRNLHSKIDGIS